MTVHCKKCIHNREVWNSNKNKYVSEYPNYCKHCNGWGYIGSDTCSYCTDVGKCPRCGCETLDDHAEQCNCCGFWFMEPGSEGISDEPECFCDYEEGETL